MFSNSKKLISAFLAFIMVFSYSSVFSIAEEIGNDNIIKLSIKGKEISLTKDSENNISVSVPEGEGGTLITETGALVPCNVDLKTISADDIFIEGNASVKEFNQQDSTLTLTVGEQDYILELYMIGDVDGNKLVNVKDAGNIVMACNEMISFTDKQEIIGDIDENIVANVNDVLEIIKANNNEIASNIYISNAPLEGNDDCYFIGENGNTSSVSSENIPNDNVLIEAVPSKDTVQVGEEFYVDFKIKNNPGFSGYSFTMKYDPNVVQPIKDFDYKEFNKFAEVFYENYEGNNISAIGASLIKRQIKDVSNGEEYFVSLVNNFDSMANNNGIMFRVPFKAISGGSSNIILRERNGAFLINGDGIEIQSYTKAANVKVKEPLKPLASEVYRIDTDGTATKVEGITNAPDDGKVVITAEPDRPLYKQGEIVAVDFYLKNNPGFRGYSIGVKYDPEILEPYDGIPNAEANGGVEVGYNSDYDDNFIIAISQSAVKKGIQSIKDGKTEKGLINFNDLVSYNGDTAIGDGLAFRVYFKVITDLASTLVGIQGYNGMLFKNDENFGAYSEFGVINIDNSYTETETETDTETETSTETETGTDGDFEFENGVITKYKGNDKNVNIPEKINNIDVQKIDDLAFYKKQIKSVVIPDSVSEIGDFSFFRCSDLESVTLSQNLKSIGEFAFFDCGSIKNFDIPESVTSIGQFAFYSSGIQNINISANVSSIGLMSFGGTSANIYVDVNNQTYSSENSILYNKDKSSLIFVGGSPKSVVVPKSVSSIEPSAFSSCTQISKVEIPKNVNNIAKNAFEYCDNVTLKVIKDSYAESFAKENDIDYIVSLDPDKKHIFGDVNGDGTVNFDDASLLLQKILDNKVAVDTGIRELFKLLDVNGDGVITSVDVSLIIKKAINNSFKFPVEIL